MENPQFHGIIFDMDGTMTVPAINFKDLRKELGISGDDIMTEINKWEEEKQHWARGVIEKYEEEGRRKCELQPGVKKTLLRLRESGILTAISTRNSLKSVDEFLKIINVDFDHIVTREFAYLKPDPRVVEHILSVWGLPVEKVLIVGDYIHDIECGRAAGIRTCFFKNPGVRTFSEYADYTVSSYSELEKLIFKYN